MNASPIVGMGVYTRIHTHMARIDTWDWIFLDWIGCSCMRMRGTAWDPGGWIG